MGTSEVVKTGELGVKCCDAVTACDTETPYFIALYHVTAVTAVLETFLEIIKLLVINFWNL